MSKLQLLDIEMELIKAFQKDEGLLNDIRSSVNTETGFRIWWLGQSGFLLQYRGEHLLFDPYLSDSLSVKYQHTDKPHVRMSELAVDPSLLNMIDVVTSSHNHTDHLDAETLIPLFDSNPTIAFVAPEANRDFIADRCKISTEKITGLTNGNSIKIGEFEIIGLPAAHNGLKTNDLGQHEFMSFVVKFGKYAVYHSGDTLWFDGLEDLLKPYNIDVAFLPINGNKPERRVAGNLNPDEAAELGKEISAKLVIPHHYNMFSFNTEDPQKFAKAAERVTTPFKVLQISEGITIT